MATYIDFFCTNLLILDELSVIGDGCMRGIPSSTILDSGLLVLSESVSCNTAAHQLKGPVLVALEGSSKGHCFDWTHLYIGHFTTGSVAKEPLQGFGTSKG